MSGATAHDDDDQTDHVPGRPPAALSTFEGSMTEHRPDRLPAQPPTVSPPPTFVDRRVSHRREEDRIAHQEKVLLARALDLLASDRTAEERLSGLLRLLARTVGARRAAVVADGIERRAAVAVDADEDPAMAEALAAWLDANAPRSRARRAAAGMAPISLIVASGGDDAATRSIDAGPPAGPGDAEPVPSHPHYAVVPIPSAGEVALGFEFRRPADAERLALRLPPTMARHAAVALALVTTQLATEREVAAMQAREAERNTFMSTVAHELRTPLTGLRGYLELILGGQVADPAVELDFLERSLGIVGSMGDLVGDLLELSRLESGTLELETGPFSMAEAGGQVAAQLLPLAIERGIRFTTSFPPRLRVARGDRRRVEQILTNLAANALKFTPTGGTVELVATFDGPVAVAIVRDDGAGIPVDDRARIFERFQRMADHERITGTGLGLPIARDLARRMDGDLDVASVPGTGSAFVLVLPGPADVEPTVVAATLERTLAAETDALLRQRLPIAVERGRGAGRAFAGQAGVGQARRRGTGILRALPAPRPETPTPA